MQIVNKKFILWVLPILIATVTLAGTNNSASAQDTPRLRSKTAEGTLVQVSSTALKMKSREGDLDINLTPDTRYHRTETGLQASELKAGDTLRFTLKGTDGLPVIESLTPLALRYSDSTLLTLPNDPKLRFERMGSLVPSELAVGQTTKIASNVYPDGKMEARDVWLIIKPSQKVAANE